jgi:hypothetical protein
MARRVAADSAPVSISALAAALRQLPLADLRRYLDRVLTRLVVARVVLEDRDPQGFNDWFDDLARHAFDAMEGAPPAPVRRKPS